MWLLNRRSNNVRNLLYTIGKVSLLTPAQLGRHKQLPGLVDAVFVLQLKKERTKERKEEKNKNKQMKNSNDTRNKGKHFVVQCL